MKNEKVISKNKFLVEEKKRQRHNYQLAYRLTEKGKASVERSRKKMKAFRKTEKGKFIFKKYAEKYRNRIKAEKIANGTFQFNRSHPRIGKGVVVHGMYKTRFYRIWHGIITRCCDSSDHNYKYYGARGIKLCDRWRNSFVEFKNDLYESYLKHCMEFGEKDTSLDRYPNPAGNYCPENVRWATDKEQGVNKIKKYENV